jgi:hypothetical protein
MLTAVGRFIMLRMGDIAKSCVRCYPTAQVQADAIRKGFARSMRLWSEAT